MKIKALKPNDTIGLICPSSKADMTSSRLPKMEEILSHWGYHVRYGASCYQEDGYLAGTDEERIQDIINMFKDPTINAIICLKGGYGASRIIDAIDFNIIRANPKLFIGFSDITVLLNNFYTKASLPTIHGQVGIFLGSPKQDDFSLTDFKTLLQQPQRGRILKSPAPALTLSSGVTEGVMVGGNLSLIATLVGTPYQIDFKDHIVLIEEVNEAPYRIDRMFSQLRLSGALKQAKGIVLGHFTDCQDATPTSRTVDMLCQEYFGSLRIPVLSHFATGHDFPFINCPIGLRVRLDANHQTLTIMEELYEKN